MPHPIAIPANLNSMTPAQAAAVGYLARYTNTRTFGIYRHYLNQWFTWCTDAGLDPMTATRTHVDLYVRHLIDAGYKPASVHTMLAPVRGFYKLAYADGVIDRDPAVVARLPKIQDPVMRQFDRDDIRGFLIAARDTSPRHFAAASLLAILGMRVTEACSIDIAQVRNIENGCPVLRFVGKGDKPAAIPIPYQVMHTLEQLIGDRTDGPVLTNLDGTRMTRGGVRGLLATVSNRIGLERPVNPHLLRKAAITLVIDDLGLDEGQKFGRHSDPRTTLRSYYLNKDNPFGHPAYLVGAKLAV